MGLDCFWKNAQGQTAKLNREFKVCNGIESDNGIVSFRGKVYNDLVKTASGKSLYQEVIDAETCRHISQCLDKFDFDTFEDNYWDIQPDEFEQFKEMFRAHISLGHFIVSSW